MRQAIMSGVEEFLKTLTMNELAQLLISAVNWGDTEFANAIREEIKIRKPEPKGDK